MAAQPATLPPDSLLARHAWDYQDSFRILLEREITPLEAGKAFFSSAPVWVERLFALRNRLVGWLGLKIPQGAPRAFTGTPGEQMGLFRVFERTSDELILGEDDQHLDFRVSLFVEQGGLTLSTVVRYHHFWGRLYFLPVAPFHRMVVPAMLRGMQRNLLTPTR